MPQEVLEQASQAVKSWDNQGLSLVEMSHRSPAFVDTMEECRALTKELLGLPDRFEILYLQGYPIACCLHCFDLFAQMLS